jgi:hypothetical protein
MLKRLTFLAGLVMALVCAAEAVGPVKPDLKTLRLAVRTQLRARTTATTLLSDTVVDQAINRGLSQTCNDFPAYEKVCTLTVSGTGEGAALLSNFVEIYAVTRSMGDSIRFPLTYLTPDSLAKYEASKTTVSQPEPSSFKSFLYYYTFGGRLILHPKARTSRNDTLLVMYFAEDTTLVDTASTAKIKAKYLEKVILYACWALSVTQGDGRATAYLAAYAEGMPPKPWRKLPEER